MSGFNHVLILFIISMDAKMVSSDNPGKYGNGPLKQLSIITLLFSPCLIACFC